MAATLAEQQEQSLKDVHDSAFVALAEGGDLDHVAENNGFARKPAQKSTGAASFTFNSPMSSDTSISSGSVVRTSDGTEFETTDSYTASVLDTFEDGSMSEYTTTGSASFTAQTTTVLDGTTSLKADASGGAGDAYVTGTQTRISSEYHAFVRVESGADVQLLFLTSDDSNTYRIHIDEAGGQILVDDLTSGTANTHGSTSVTWPTATKLKVRFRPRADRRVWIKVTDTTDGSEVVEFTSDQLTEWERTEGGFGFGADAGVAYFDTYTYLGVGMPIEALTAGDEGNVGTSSITEMSTPPAGVDGVTNYTAVGDTDNTHLTGVRFRNGRDEESDTQLRNRIKKQTATGGDATVNAVLRAIQDLRGVRAVTYLNNRTTTDNNNGNNITAKSVELLVDGGDKDDIAEAIFDNLSFTDGLDAGSNGTRVTHDVEAVNGQEETIEFARPSVQDVDFTIDITTTSDYIGDDAVRDRIVQYVGGTESSGEAQDGELTLGEDVFLSRVRDEVVGTDTGVRSITSLTTTPSATTNGNSEDIVSVASNEVAETDATDGSITLNTTNV